MAIASTFCGRVGAGALAGVFPRHHVIARTIGIA